jgi:hypothetical protein
MVADVLAKMPLLLVCVSSLLLAVRKRSALLVLSVTKQQLSCA